MNPNLTHTVNMNDFPARLTGLYVGLKLTGYLTWSWFWVLSPLWFGFILGFFVFALGIITAQQK